ncbi:MAG: tripartite tricarboxylate transporter TctB family protein [Deltaproteobacteria bacterium]|nr:tripartite tricarboxylate transporter TctB family protein [Deltaproteobacteria bacterium]
MKGSTLLGVILVATAALFFGWSFSYGGMAGFVPLVLAFPTLLLAALCLAGERYPRILSAFEVSLEDVLSSAAGAEDVVETAQQGPKAGELGLIVRMFVWFAAFGVLVFITGFYVSTFLFAVLFTHKQGGIGWPGTAFITALALGFFYFIFERTLAVDLFAGVIFGAFIPPL